MRKPKKCEEEGCEKTDVIECRVAIYKTDLFRWGFIGGIGYTWWLLRRNGLSWMWRLLIDGFEDDREFYCPEHSQKNGYCRCCGDFWAGIESYDFFHPGLCDNCYDQIRDDFDEWEEDECEPDFTPERAGAYGLDELEWDERYPELVDAEDEL